MSEMVILMGWLSWHGKRHIGWPEREGWCLVRKDGHIWWAQLPRSVFRPHRFTV